MKKQTLLLGLISTLIFFTGIIFKGMHWPGAAKIIGMGVILGNLYLIIFLAQGSTKFKPGLDRSMAYFGAISLIFVLSGFLFKISHWPGANILTLVSHVFLLILSILLMISAYRESDASTQSLKAFFAFAVFTLTSIIWFLGIRLVLLPFLNP